MGLLDKIFKKDEDDWDDDSSKAGKFFKKAGNIAVGVGKAAGKAAVATGKYTYDKICEFEDKMTEERQKACRMSDRELLYKLSNSPFIMKVVYADEARARGFNVDKNFVVHGRSYY